MRQANETTAIRWVEPEAGREPLLRGRRAVGKPFLGTIRFDQELKEFGEVPIDSGGYFRHPVPAGL